MMTVARSTAAKHLPLLKRQSLRLMARLSNSGERYHRQSQVTEALIVVSLNHCIGFASLSIANPTTLTPPPLGILYIYSAQFPGPSGNRHPVSFTIYPPCYIHFSNSAFTLGMIHQTPFSPFLSHFCLFVHQILPLIRQIAFLIEHVFMLSDLPQHFHFSFCFFTSNVTPERTCRFFLPLFTTLIPLLVQRIFIPFCNRA